MGCRTRIALVPPASQAGMLDFHTRDTINGASCWNCTSHLQFTGLAHRCLCVGGKKAVLEDMQNQQQIPIQPMPVEFDVIVADTAADLKTNVNALLKKGWIFHGAMQSANEKFIQPMCRLELRPFAMPKQDTILPVTLDLK